MLDVAYFDFSVAFIYNHHGSYVVFFIFVMCSGGPKISILGMPKPPEQWLTKNRVVIEVSRRSIQ